MYVLKQTFLKKIDSEESYQNYNINSFTIEQILNSFVDGYFVLTHRKLKGTFYLTLEKLRASKIPLVMNLTLQDWFGLNSTLELDTVKVKPSYKTGIVKYSDAILAGYNINKIGRRMPKGANISNADMVDLLVEKNNVPRNELYTKALFTVSGFLHRATPHENGVALIGGGETVNLTKNNTVGVYSFKECSRIYQMEIQEDMVINTSPEVPLSQATLLNTKMDLTNKCVFISLAGHLILGSGLVEIVNYENGFVKINTSKLRLPDILLACVDKINVDQTGVFNVTDKEATNYKVRYNDIVSDICVKQMFLLQQSFIVVVEADNIGVNRIPVQQTGLPTVYEYHEEPSLPLCSSRGLLIEYWKQFSSWGWLIKITNDIETFKLNETVLSKRHQVMMNNQSYQNKWYHDSPELLKIETITKEKQ